MAAANIRTLYNACCVDDVATVRRLLPLTPVGELNRSEDDGKTCLHAAASRGNREIVQLLLDRGAVRQMRDRNGRTPADVAPIKSVKEILNQPPEQKAIQRYVFDESDNQRINWIFGRDKAEAFSRAVYRGCIKNRGVRKTVRKIEKAKIIPTNDESKEGKTLVAFFNQAREQNDATYFIRMYTIDGMFYRTINQYMAEGKSRKVFKKLCHKWSGYYVGCIMKDPVLFKYRFAGVTYRGMVIDRDAFEQYKYDTVVTNKALQSSSKLPRVALRFARTEPTFGKVSVLIQYTIVDHASALDIKDLSEFPEEDEVLMFPGILFMTDYVNKNVEPYEIHLRQLPWANE